MSDGDSFDPEDDCRAHRPRAGQHRHQRTVPGARIKIGSTKADFEKNIFDVINAGQLTREMIEAWLLQVAGWGDQHVYVLTPPPTPSP